MDLDVLVGLEAREADHSSREVGDFDGGAHVEDEDLVAFAHRRGFHHEAAGLGDGHEEAVDVGVRHRHGPALGDLLLEARDHRSVAPQHVSEPRRYEARGGCRACRSCRCLEGSIPRRDTFLLPDGRGSPAGGGATGSRQPQTLHIYFGQALRAAHHVRGIHRLIRADHHHRPDPILQALLRHIPRPIHIHQHRLAGILLHQRHMLVRRRVEHRLRPMRPEREIQALGMPHVADDRHETQLRESLFQFQPQVVHRRLRIVEEHQFAYAESRQLAAEL